jgi:Tfp pilus assembly protein PilF
MKKIKVFLLIQFLCLPLSLGSGIPVNHIVKGRVFTIGKGNASRAKIVLQRQDQSLFGKQPIGFDGAFVFDAVPPGEYLLLIEPEEGATVARPLRIQAYPTAKIVFLEIRLSSDGSANVREVVKEYSKEASFAREEKSTRVSKKAQQEFDQAIQESSRGNSSKAIEHLQKAVKEAPDFFEAYNNLGAQYQKLNQYDAASQAYQKAISLRDETAKPHINLGMIYWAQGRLEDAVREFKQALQFDANLPIANLSLGRILLQKKQFHLAEPYLELAIRLDPQSCRLGFLDLIRLYLAHHDQAKAAFFVEKFLEYFPNDSEGLELQKASKQIGLSSEAPQ